MSPYQHGEVFVTDDGAETDLDLGHYERFVDVNLNVNSSVTSGKVYWSVLNKERNGDYLGGTVQIIPHITNELKDRIYRMEKGEAKDVIITEIGGTVGDMESQAFLEAIRQISRELPREDCMFIHVSLVVSIPGTGELKSKPTQHSCKGLTPPSPTTSAARLPCSATFLRRTPFPTSLPPSSMRSPSCWRRKVWPRWSASG